MKKIKMCISSKIDKDQMHVLRYAKYLLLKESQDFLHQIFCFQRSVITCFSLHLFDKNDQNTRERYGRHTIQQLTSIAHMILWTHFLAYERAFLKRVV